MEETVESLAKKSKEQVQSFIREKLTYALDDQQFLQLGLDENNRRRKFDMSGYESENGTVTVRNLSILNTFAALGIYNYTSYLFLDFYKGTPTLYLKYFNENENKEFNLGGYSTSEIIYEVFQHTIFSGKPERRRG